MQIQTDPGPDPRYSSILVLGSLPLATFFRVFAQENKLFVQKDPWNHVLHDTEGTQQGFRHRAG
jgi:hypothetical protein